MIQILPALARFQPIKLHLVEIEVDSAVPYKALSYVWGGQVPDRQVLCNGKALLVTQNAEEAIRRLRQRHAKCLLWIDAICIDQLNTDEKNHQVAFMGDVYRSAEEVVVWLGYDMPRFDIMQRMATLANSSNVSTTSGSKHTRLSSASHSIYSRFRYGFTDIRKQNCRAVKKFLDHDYWQRAWTVQEFILNDSCAIYDRVGKIDRAKFWEGFLDRFINRHDTAVLYTTKFYHSIHFIRCFDLVHSRNQLGVLLRFAHQLKSQISHDKVFALKAVYPLLLDGVTIDYDQTTTQTYTDAARAIIAATKNLLILPFACQRGEKGQDFPSWVPAWSLPVLSWATYRDVRNAWFSLSTPVPPDAEYKFSNSFKTLHVTGLFVSSIAVCQLLVMDWERDETSGRTQVLFASIKRRSKFFSGCGHDWQAIATQVKACMDFVRWSDSRDVWMSRVKAVGRVNRPKPVSSAEDHPWEDHTWEDSMAKWLGMCIDPNEYLPLLDRRGIFSHPCMRDTDVGVLETIFFDLVQTRSLFVTADGHFGICQDVRPNDRLVLIAGCPKPLVIREAGVQVVEGQSDEHDSMPRYRLVGEAFISPQFDGMMWSKNDALVEIALV